jgi:predicted  nucleic acid-binding Zn-ribbon protein
MVDSIVPYVSVLKKKLLLLFNNYKNLEIEKNTLQVSNNDLNNRVKSLESKIKLLQKNIEDVNIAKSFDAINDSPSEIGRKRVNQLIREIDKCIALLNE